MGLYYLQFSHLIMDMIMTNGIGKPKKPETDLPPKEIPTEPGKETPWQEPSEEPTNPNQDEP